MRPKVSSQRRASAIESSMAEISRVKNSASLTGHAHSVEGSR